MYQNLVKHLGWSVFRKKITGNFAKSFILDKRALFTPLEGEEEVRKTNSIMNPKGRYFLLM